MRKFVKGTYFLIQLLILRISELDAQFADLQVKEQQWPLPGSDVMPMYKKYLTHTYKLGQNIVCACCGCISHDITEFEIVLDSYGPLRHLRISEDVNIPFDFSCGIDVLDQNRILIDKLGITQDKRIYLCRICHNQLSKDHQPSEALANFRWIKMSLSEVYNVKGGRPKVKGDGNLSVIPGAPLMITEIIDICLGLVNGAIVEFYGFADSDGALIRDEIITTPPAYMLIKLKHDVGVEIALPGLPPSVVGIEPKLLTY